MASLLALPALRKKEASPMTKKDVTPEWVKWEQKNLVTVDFLAKALVKLLDKAPDGTQAPDSFYELRDLLRTWNL